ncbi:MarR family transcriptional regulator [Eubacteriaceae bacterium ES2]|nr:MarR family transcriptional regulator [Eubacteriaceae bacterium ES2]
MKKDKKDKKEKKFVEKESKKKKVTSEKKSGPVKKIEPAPKSASESLAVATEKAIATEALSIKTIDEILALMKNNAENYQNIITAPTDFNVLEQTLALFPSELKTLEIIGQTPGINLTQLSIELGISKSAVSKCTGKMLEKSLINKQPSPTNIRQVQFFLSDEGKTVFEQYLQHQQDLFKPLYHSFDLLTSTDADMLLAFLKSFSIHLNEIEQGATAGN